MTRLTTGQVHGKTVDLRPLPHRELMAQELGITLLISRGVRLDAVPPAGHPLTFEPIGRHEFPH